MKFWEKIQKDVFKNAEYGPGRYNGLRDLIKHHLAWQTKNPRMFNLKHHFHKRMEIIIQERLNNHLNTESVNLSIYLSIYLSVYLSIYLYV